MAVRHVVELVLAAIQVDVVCRVRAVRNSRRLLQHYSLLLQLLDLAHVHIEQARLAQLLRVWKRSALLMLSFARP